MNPLLVLACGMAVVITGILVLRMHAFLALIIGAFAVSLLTPENALRAHADQRIAKAEWTANEPATQPQQHPWPPAHPTQPEDGVAQQSERSIDPVVGGAQPPHA